MTRHDDDVDAQLRFIDGTNIVKWIAQGDEKLANRLGHIFHDVMWLNEGWDPRDDTAGQILGRRPMPVHRRLRLYREYTRDLMTGLGVLIRMLDVYHRQVEQYKGALGESAGRRWTPEQDEALVEYACKDGATMLGLAVLFNRSPAAVSARLTYLVGVSKSRHVVGRITGLLDGEPVSGVFDGELRSS